MANILFFFVMSRRPPRSTRTDTLFPYTTLCRSFRTLTRAQVAVRDANAKGDVVVRIADGLYRLDAPITLTAADGGQKGWVVTWTAAPGAKPVLSGGIAVTGWTLHDKARRLYENGRASCRERGCQYV